MTNFSKIDLGAGECGNEKLKNEPESNKEIYVFEGSGEMLLEKC